MRMIDASGCELCSAPGGVVLWSNEHLRVVRVDDPDYPGFLRVIWQGHVREMSDLDAAQRSGLLAAVFAAEHALIDLLHPDKVNLASLGNMTPHLHWHVIPRFRGDPHFPDPVWAARRGGVPVALPMPVADYEQAVTAAMARQMPG
ncbi:MAG: HIT family protein [Rhodocyclaceae bacterium]|jgi:diadenosine tetraphosphate (Ap4A) HIT family hydrolase|nr:HIT family protein [Rhodocyclaceae bacterium]MCE2981879.1 HIT family protein [Betaproteobacteria bacterium]MCA3075586.1 HIT family protein [Rhodocyclaceae bacterium]MCA3092060.1 HIT family protein [Rhodocyclaceae bacterium]MCA3095983.1 HIT family protein [Rhodocyclaceae bacterium]